MPLDFSHLKITKPKKHTKRMQAVLLPALETIVWDALKHDECPVCGRRAYWNREKTLIYCKSKEHKFALPRQKYNDIISGKTLEDYKQFQKSLTK